MTRLLAFLAFLFAPLGASAQALQCGERQVMVDRIFQEHGATQRGVALSASGNLVEIFANLETGAWGILTMPPGGLACLVAYGSSYQPTGEPLVTGEPA